jgi:branched-chain amino acid transport system ATP-binding protein
MAAIGGAARSEPRLEARDVHVAFGGIKALSGVTLDVRKGEIVGLIGPNGAGKTTLVNVLTGFQQPSSGEVLLNGRPLVGMKARDVARAGIGRSFQGARLFRDLTAAQNVAVAGIGRGLSGRAAHAKAKEILEWMGCGEIAERACDSLSYGDERRISIARALALDPDFALLDEPASGMNDSECEALMKVISEVPARFGCGILLIEHNMKVIMGLCHRIHVIDGGRSLAEGTPSEVQSNPEVRRAYLGEKADHAELAI